MNERFNVMLDWMHNLAMLSGKEVTNPVPASSDASFRRYFRIQVTCPEKGESSYIIMDAPVEFEDCRPFIAVSQQLVKMGLHVPEVLAQNLELGFLLLSDLGNQTYLSVLTSASESESDQLYQAALTSLVTLQTKGKAAANQLSAYNGKLLETEMNLFSDWLLGTHLDLGLDKVEKANWQTTKDFLQNSALAQPTTYVHRDYHSRNLMVTPESNPGILDFQDAVKGPLTYDAVSLLRDCYIAWPADQVVEWQRGYFLQLCAAKLATKNEWSAFQKSMDFMGIQRHLKASGIFARLNHRDGKENYLNDIPLTLNYLVEIGSKYAEMTDLVRLVENKVLKHTLLK